MNGPEHYKAAEECLQILDLERRPEQWERALSNGSVAVAMQAAQVHATLALAAAVALRGESINATGDWLPVAGAS